MIEIPLSAIGGKRPTNGRRRKVARKRQPEDLTLAMARCLRAMMADLIKENRK